MLATPEDARLLFDRWREQSRALHIKLLSGGLIFHATGVVADFTQSTLQMAGSGWQFTIPLGNASYKFSDPREIPIAAVREAETSKYELGLAVELADGNRISLMEIKEPAETRD